MARDPQPGSAEWVQARITTAFERVTEPVQTFMKTYLKDGHTMEFQPVTWQSLQDMPTSAAMMQIEALLRVPQTQADGIKFTRMLAQKMAAQGMADRFSRTPWQGG